MMKVVLNKDIGAVAGNMCPHCHVTVGSQHAVGCPQGPGMCGAVLRSAMQNADLVLVPRVALHDLSIYLSGGHYEPRTDAEGKLGAQLLNALSASIASVPCTHKKTGNPYLFLGEELDCTNSRDGTRVARYIHADKPQDVPYIRDVNEFWAKFERTTPQSLPAVDTAVVRAEPHVPGTPVSAREIAGSLPAGEWELTKRGDAYLGVQTRLALQVERNLSPRVLQCEDHDPRMSADAFATDLLAVIGEHLTPRKTAALVKMLSETLREHVAQLDSATEPAPGEGDKPGLTVDAAYELLGAERERGRGDAALVVPYEPGYDTCGPTPAMPITDMHAGFDWNHNKILLTTKKKLGASDEDLQRLRATNNVTARELYQISQLAKDARLTSDQKIEAIQAVETRRVTAAAEKRNAARMRNGPAGGLPG